MLTTRIVGFMLSRFEPVGIMIYGAAEFMDVPLETEAKGISTPVATVVNPLTSRGEWVRMTTSENLLKAPKPVRLDARDPIAQARRADAQRRQASAAPSPGTRKPPGSPSPSKNPQPVPKVRLA